MQGDGGDGASKPPEAQRRPKSQRPHCAWKLDLTLPIADGPRYLGRLKAAADKLLVRAGNGGTDSLLRVIIGVGDMAASSAPLAAPTPDAAAAASCNTHIQMCSANAVATTGASFFTARITMFFIFDPEGRLKSSVKRSIKKLDECDQLFQSALAALEPWSSASVLAFIMEHPSESVRASWLGAEQPLLAYLQARVAEGVQTDAARVSNSAAFMCAGMDLLGPQSRKRPLPIEASQGGGSGSAEAVLAAEAVPAHGEQKSSNERLSELLSWTGGLTQDQAAQRATDLLTFMHATLEENALLKIQAAAAAPDPPNAKVCVHSPMPMLLLTCLCIAAAGNWRKAATR